jgi:hypothetical protein
MIAQLQDFGGIPKPGNRVAANAQPPMARSQKMPDSIGAEKGELMVAFVCGSLSSRRIGDNSRNCTSSYPEGQLASLHPQFVSGHLQPPPGLSPPVSPRRSHTPDQWNSSRPPQFPSGCQADDNRAGSGFPRTLKSVINPGGRPELFVASRVGDDRVVV